MAHGTQNERSVHLSSLISFVMAALAMIACFCLFSSANAAVFVEGPTTMAHSGEIFFSIGLLAASFAFFALARFQATRISPHCNKDQL